MLITRTLIGVLLTLTLGSAASAQNAHLAVIVGLAGDPEHGELFQKWGSALVDAGTKRYGIPRERIVYLVDKPDGSAGTGRSTRDEVTKALEALAQKSATDDVVFLVLIGHGTF